MRKRQLSIHFSVLTLCALLVLAVPASHKATAMAATAMTAKATLSGQAAPFPARQNTAPTGSEFLRQTSSMDPAEREQAILTEIESGNIPGHLRNLVPVQIRSGDHRATIYVLPDYLAIGSDDDYVIIPMTPRTAMRIAREFGFTLPTRKMVDDIYRNSNVQLKPEPMQPGAAMTTNAYYQEHDCRIKSKMPQEYNADQLTAGHKKDVVLTPRLQRQPERVAIYGWHRSNDHPIQPLSLVHGVEYVDYSHGVRLVSLQATVDGEATDLTEVFADPELNPLVSDEGKVSMRSYL